MYNFKQQNSSQDSSIEIVVYTISMDGSNSTGDFVKK
jgi:hypothetical protein